MNPSPEPRVLYSQMEIATTVKRLAAEVTHDYRGKHPLLVGVLKGSFVFLADLARRLDFPVEVDFVHLSSYGHCTQTSGKIKLLKGLRQPIRDRHLVVVEDIIDTGLTTTYLLAYLKKKKPASVKLCALVNKPSRRQVPVAIDYLGFTAPNKFIVGYGIDFDEKYRNLPAICSVEVEC